MDNMDLNIQNETEEEQGEGTEVQEEQSTVDGVQEEVQEEQNAVDGVQEEAQEEQSEEGTNQEDAVEPEESQEDPAQTQEIKETVESVSDEIWDRYFIKKPKGMSLGGLMEFFGFSFAMFFSVALIGVIALDVALQGISILFVPMIGLAMIVAILLFIGVKGRKMRNRIKRFNKYKRTLAGRELCDIEELAGVIEKSQEFVVSDLKDMFERGWFLQGHIDPSNKHLIVTDTMYEQYRLVMLENN